MQLEISFPLNDFFSSEFYSLKVLNSEHKLLVFGTDQYFMVVKHPK